jgi:hypothetical protein
MKGNYFFLGGSKNFHDVPFRKGKPILATYGISAIPLGSNGGRLQGRRLNYFPIDLQKCFLQGLEVILIFITRHAIMK